MFNGLDRRARHALRTAFFLLGCVILAQFTTLAHG
jgi:thiol:disulfide interchange protein DsbD